MRWLATFTLFLFSFSAFAGDISTLEKDGQKDATLHEVGQLFKTYQGAYYGYSLVFIDGSGNACIPGQTGCAIEVKFGGAATPGYSRLMDDDTLNLVTVSQANAASYTGAEYALSTLGFNLYYNGATWDPAVSTPTGEAAVQDTSTRPGEDASAALRWAGIKDHITVEPGMQGPTAVTSTKDGVDGVIVLSKRKILHDASWCVSIRNVGGGSGDDLSDAIVQVSPTGETNTWENITGWVVCDTLANNNKTCSYCSDEARGWVQVEALCAATEDTTVSAWYRARK